MFNGRQKIMTQPDLQVTPKAERRHFNAEYKLRILSEADACTERGQLGALLRREGLYSSLLEKWRAQRERGALAGLARRYSTPRLPKPVPGVWLLKASPHRRAPRCPWVCSTAARMINPLTISCAKG